MIRSVLRWIGGLLVAFAVALGVLRFVGHSAAESFAEAALASLALAAIVAVPGVLTLLAAAGRPALLVPVGVVLVPLAFVSFAGVTLPLLIPAVLVWVVYARHRRDQPRPTVPAAVIAVVVLACLVAALLTLFAHPDPRTYSTATGGGGTSDVITIVESVTALALTALAVVLADGLSRPARSTRV